MCEGHPVVRTRSGLPRSTDSLTWGEGKKTANNATGIGGQPLVQPNGSVIVPIDNFNQTALLAFQSIDGGAAWSSLPPDAHARRCF